MSKLLFYKKKNFLILFKIIKIVLFYELFNTKNYVCTNVSYYSWDKCNID